MSDAERGGPLVVAIDGPAGSGKSSVSREVARRLGFAFLDTGAAYRAFAWHARASGVDLEADASTESDEPIVGVLDSFDVDIDTDPGGSMVTVGGADVTAEIRDPRVTSVVSRVARVPAVRAHLGTVFCSSISRTTRPGIVVEGRDITTVVAPDAPVRILLTAAEEVRVARRSAELVAEHPADVGRQLAARDRADSRVVDFMNAADGVITVDSTTLDFDQTVDAVMAVIEGRSRA